MKCFASKGVALLLLCYGTAWGQGLDSTRHVGRWYVGGGVAIHGYFTINQPYSPVRPAYLMGGYVFKPQRAYQVEVQHGRRTEDSNGGDSMIDGEIYNFRTKSQINSTAITLLTRFSRSRPQRHLQFDWLLGVAAVHTVMHEATTRTSATRSESYVYPTKRSTEPHLVGGISLRYLVSSRLTLGTELLLSKNLHILPYGWGLIPGAGATIGVSYLFGPGKS